MVSRQSQPRSYTRNETLSFHVAPSTTTFKATVYGKPPVPCLADCEQDHHTLGKDPELGEAEVEVSSMSFPC
jgi:hypothetical protein